MVFLPGAMEKNMKVNLRKDTEQGKVSMFLKVELYMKGISLKIN